MKTIERAASIYAEPIASDLSHKNMDDLNICDLEDYIVESFKEGVEFATKWISVDEELPRIGEKVITKMNKDKRTSYGIATRIREEWEIDAHWIDHTFSNMNITHWRPIELK
jgi:hypothetical protein